VHFDHEVGRIIQSCGIGDEVRAISEPAEVYEWRNGQGTTLLRFGRVGAAKSGWPFSSMFCQPELEALLQGRAGSLPTLDVRRGVRVRGVEQHADHVVVDQLLDRARQGDLRARPGEGGCTGRGDVGRLRRGVSDAPDLSGIVGGLVAAGAPLAGELFPQGRLDGAWFDDVYGVGWRLVTVDPDAGGLDRTLVDWLGTIGGAVVDVAGAALDLAAWFDAHGVRWALQRPDFHLFGAAADRPMAARLVADLRRRLAPAPTTRPAGRTA
jgi:hypothetical protein